MAAIQAMLQTRILVLMNHLFGLASTEHGRTGRGCAASGPRLSSPRQSVWIRCEVTTITSKQFSSLNKSMNLMRMILEYARTTQGRSLFTSRLSFTVLRWTAIDFLLFYSSTTTLLEDFPTQVIFDLSFKLSSFKDGLSSSEEMHPTSPHVDLLEMHALRHDEVERTRSLKVAEYWLHSHEESEDDFD